VSGKRKVSDAGIEWIIDIVARRRELERKLSMFPTNKGLAEELGVTERWILAIVRKHARVGVSRGAKKDADTSSHLNNPR
jgi:hypothetical protein